MYLENRCTTHARDEQRHGKDARFRVDMCILQLVLRAFMQSRLLFFSFSLLPSYRHEDIAAIIIVLSWVHAWRRINAGSGTDTDRSGVYNRKRH